MSFDIYIKESQNHCALLGIDPLTMPSFSKFLSPDELRKKRRDFQEILVVTHFFSNKLLNLVKGIPVLILISDENGCILDMSGDETIKSIVNASGIQTGLIFTEEEAGTNSVTLAINHDEPMQLIGRDHYYHFLEHSACYTIPFHKPENQEILGTITMMTSIDQHHPFLLGMLSTVVDSIERELRLIHQNKRLNILNQLLIGTTLNGMIMTDKAGIIKEYNQFAETLFGIKKQFLLQKPVQMFSFGNYIQDVLQQEIQYENLELTIENNGQSVVCMFDASPIYDEKNQLMGAYAQFRDITERYKAQKQVQYLAYHDDLTGLPNRRQFILQVSELIQISAENQLMFAIIMIDLDGFKKINDNLGHSNGDVLIKLVTKRLKTIKDESHVIFRMGGDEFMVLIKDLRDVSGAYEFAEKMLELFNQPFTLDQYELFITASMGISFYPDHGEDVEVLMKNADIAMYRTKEEGKNSYSTYRPNYKHLGIEQLTMEGDLRKAIQRNEFVVYYQPQIDASTGKIFGVEALIRWNHPSLGLVPPSTFIPIAEETGLIVPIGKWVIQTACRQVKKWIDAGMEPLHLSVNLSVKQFLKQHFVEDVQQILTEIGFDPNFLDLEITESMTMDINYANEVLNELKELGIRISIDDFGTGYSNLYYLKKFSIDRLKIDKSFIQDMMTDSNYADIVATMITIAKTLGIDVIAEGVETLEQLEFLINKKSSKMQGFYFHPPLPVDQIEELLLKNSDSKS